MKDKLSVKVEDGACPTTCEITATHTWAAFTAKTCKVAKHHADEAFETSDDSDIYTS